MGLPGRTFFCENGHVVTSYGHHEWGDDLDDNFAPVCRSCGSSNIRCHTEWGDSDYYQEVPMYCRSDGTYDVSLLFAPEKIRRKAGDLWQKWIDYCIKVSHEHKKTNTKHN